MKKHILKNILKGVAAAAAFALASCSFLSVDDDSGSSSGSGSERGAVSVSMFVPDYYAISAGTSARVVAPQINSVRLGYKAGTAAEYTYLDAVELSDSEKITVGDSGLSGTQYKITFSGIPAVTYAADALVVELLDSSNNVVSSGTNSKSVTIEAGGKVSASFYTIPTSSDAASGSLSAGEMKFAKEYLVANANYTVTVSVGDSDTTYPSIFLFNSDGTYNSVSTLDSSTHSATITVEESGAYYLGIYSAAAVSSYSLSFAVASYESNISSYEAPAISGNYYPAADSTDAFVDTDIYVAYDSDITIDRTATATITISDGTNTDTIKVADETYNVPGCNKTTASVKVGKELVMASGNVLVIKPHAILTAGTKYTVTIPTGIVSGQTEEISWSFTPKAINTPSNNTITVGTDCASINGALHYLMDNSSTGDWTINVPEGSYHEILGYYQAENPVNLTIVGADATYGSSSKVFWNNSQALGNSQRTRQSFIWEGGNLTIKNMTFKNTANRKEFGSKDLNIQAETLYFDCKADLVVYNSSFSSYQDTLLLGNNGGRAWFYKCLVEGDVDFIWGYTDVALFENCKIVCLADGIKNDAKIFASRAPAGDTAGKGFVLMNSGVVIQDGCSAAYGRSSGADTQAAVFNNIFITEGKGALSTALWGGASDTRVYEPNGEMAVGYKDRNNILNGSLVDTSNRLKNTADLSDRLYNREYNGRWTILNRQYNTKTEAYETKSSIWDISAYETEFGAPEDTSKENIYVEPVYTKNVVGGNTVQLAASTTSSSSLTYTYESSDTSIATVDSNGLVATATGVTGTATITVTASNGNTDTAVVKVIPVKIDVTSISFDAPESVDAYALSTVTVTFNPTDATIQTLNWEATGDIRIVDPDSKTAVTSLTESSLTSVQIEGIAPGGSGTLTATSTDNTSATAAKTISISSVRDYNGAEASAVNSKDETAGFGILNFQSGKVGMWHDLYVHAIYDKNNGKIAASSERVQSRYGTIYIPVTASSVIDMACQTYSDSQSFATDFTDAAGNAPTTYEGDEATYKYHYKWELDYTNDTAKIVDGATVKALYDAATKDTNRSWTNHTPNESAKYFAIVIPGADRYWTHITVTEDSSIHHDAASATLAIADFASTSVEIDLSADDYKYTQTTTATSSDSTDPTITYESSSTAVATVDSSSGKVTLTGLVGSTTITATAAHATDENVTKVKAEYTIKVVQSKATESMYFDFRGTGIVTNASAAESFDYGILTGSGKYHGASYGLNGGTINVQVVGPSRIYFAQMDFGGDVTVTSKVGTADATSVGTATTKGSGKCTKTALADAIKEGYVSYVTYTGSDAATITLAASSYFGRFWVEKYEAAAVEITASDFSSKTLTLDLNGTKTSNDQTITATVSDNSTATIAYSSSHEGVATVDSSTGAVTAVGIGRSLITATVTATGAESVKKTYVVTVKDSATPTADYSINFVPGTIFDSDTYIKGDLDLGYFVLGMGNKSEYQYNKSHGLVFKQDNSLTFTVVSGSTLVIHTCAYDKAGKIEILDSNGSAVTGATIVNTGYTANTTSSTTEASISDGVITIPAGNDGEGHTDKSTITVTLPATVTGTVKIHHYYSSSDTSYNNEIYVHAVDVTIPTSN